jgi:hypothetical protein
LYYRDKKVVGVFVRFSLALHWQTLQRLKFKEEHGVILNAQDLKAKNI